MRNFVACSILISSFTTEKLTMELMLQPLVKYATFDGRARRAEFWLFVLFNFLICGSISLITGSTDSVLVTLATVLLLLPNIAVGVRRLHDVGISGWWYLLSCVP